MGKLAIVVMAVAIAAMVAVLFGSVARDELGIPLREISKAALSVAGLVIAAVACRSLLTRKK
jgi:hypothetical protein